MIYHLFQYLERTGLDFPGLGLMHYISFRAILASVTAVLIALIAGKIISAEISSEPTRFIARTIITATTTAISRL